MTVQAKTPQARTSHGRPARPGWRIILPAWLTVLCAAEGPHVHAAPPQAAPQSAPARLLPPAQRFQYVLGTQTFNATYQFTDQPRLVETAQAIRDMGSTILKFGLCRQHIGDAGIKSLDGIVSLSDLARHGVYRRVLDMDFGHFVLWAHTLSNAQWRDGLTAAERQREHREIYDLARYLLTTYSGTGKTFYLGHWEGDWWLHEGFNAKGEPPPVAVRGMIEWLSARQQAVDDARRDTPHRDVRLFHYCEVNLVRKGMTGGTCLATHVLPHTRVEYVSYSCYDSLTGDIPKTLRQSLDFIESRLPPRPELRGKRVFIGEYGFPLIRAKTPRKQDEQAREVIRTALEWGCPMVLYWQVYCNELEKDKQNRGFWMIDNLGRKQPVYHTHREILVRGKGLVAGRLARTGKPPTDAEYREQALKWLSEPGR